jgi:hypothetical protein
VAPGAGELADQLLVHLRAPGVALAGLSALIGAGVCLLAGLLLAIVLPNASFLAVGGGAGLVKEAMAQAVSFSQANLSLSVGGGTVRTVPVLFVLIPILGVAAGASALAPRTAGMPQRQRLLWAAASGLPFALLMLVLALSLGGTQFAFFDQDVEFSAGSVFLLSLLWGALGGLLGTLYALRAAGEPIANPLPPVQARYAGLAWAALRPLLLALVAVGLLCSLAWVVQVVRERDYRGSPPRSTVIAIGEQVAYAGDHAIDTLPLGAGASERLSGYAAVPIAPSRIFDLPDNPSVDSPSTYNLFDFNDTMPVYLFVPMLVALIGIVALLALYAGFAVARAAGERRPDRAVAWGAAVGPVWALTMVLLAALARKGVVGFGDPNGDSLFLAFLLGGALLGAMGGLLSAQGSPAAPPPPPPPPAAAP